MTNPEDRWRHQTSAAPHAPSHDPLTPGLPPQGGQSFGSLGAESNYPDASTAGGQSGGGFLTAAFVVFLFAAPIFGTLYPLAAASALVAGLVTNAVLAVVARGLDSSGRTPFALLAAAIVFWTMSRLDHRLAERSMIYRGVRHVIRVLLIANFVAITSLNESGGAMPRSPQAVMAVIGDRRYLPVMLVLAVVAHLVLTRAKGLRARWHSGLQILRLRPYL